MTKLTLVDRRNDCTEVDELLLKMVDYKTTSQVAAEKLFRKCSTSWQSYQYLRDRVHDPSIPDSARQQLRRIIKRILMHMHQCREYGYADERS